jgi:translation initiation factor 4E
MAATTAEAPAASFEIKDEQRPLNEIPVSPPNANGAADDAADDKTAIPGDKEQLTVFHSADNFNVKHPLMNKWTLWYTKPPSGKVGYSGSAGNEL